MYEKTVMIETAHYCEECNQRLSPATANTEREKEFMLARAGRFHMPVDYSKAARTVQGICDGCGQEAIVDFYQISQ
jgi:hypothetical protein